MSLFPKTWFGGSAGQQKQGIGTSGHTSSNQITIGNSSTGWSTTTGVSIEQLTPEELEELKDLLEEHELNIKYRKLEEYKKLPPEVRELYINTILMHNSINKINTIDSNSVEKNSRLKELETKHSFFQNQLNYITNGAAFQQSINQWGQVKLSSPYGPLVGELSPHVIDGLTMEEIIKAHTEACLEETVLRNEDEKV